MIHQERQLLSRRFYSESYKHNLPLDIATGENEWTTSTKQQVTRLTKLINNLVSLARMQEQPTLTMVPVNVSQIAGDVASSFKSVISTDQQS